MQTKHALHPTHLPLVSSFLEDKQKKNTRTPCLPTVDLTTIARHRTPSLTTLDLVVIALQSWRVIPCSQHPLLGKLPRQTHLQTESRYQNPGKPCTALRCVFVHTPKRA